MKDVIDIKAINELESRDPLYRSAIYTNRIRQHQEAVRFLAMLRNKAVQEARDQGYPVTKIASSTALSRQQLHRVLERPFDLDTLDNEVFEMLGVERAAIEQIVSSAETEGIL